MIKRLTAVFCFLWCILLVRFSFAQWNTGNEGQEAVSVFAGTGLENTGARLEMTGELRRLSTEKKAVEKLEKAAATLGLGSEYEITEERKSNGTIWSVKGVSRISGMEGGYQTVIKVLAVRDGFFTRYYLQAAAEGAVDGAQIAAMRKRLEQIREREGLECMIGMRLDGSWDRLLSEEEKKQFCDWFLAASGARLTEQNSEGNLLMVYAYDRELGDAIMMNQEQINLNLILRDSQDGTRCFVGVPAVWSDDVAAAE